MIICIIFTDVGAGEHVITVRDKNGCGEAITTVMIMDYPLYFTPNGDGYNDTWNIYGIARPTRCYDLYLR